MQLKFVFAILRTGNGLGNHPFYFAVVQYVAGLTGRTSCILEFTHGSDVWPWHCTTECQCSLPDLQVSTHHGLNQCRVHEREAKRRIDGGREDPQDLGQIVATSILFPPCRRSASWFVSHWWRQGICRLVSTHPLTSSVSKHPSTDHSGCAKSQNIATKLISA